MENLPSKVVPRPVWKLRPSDDSDDTWRQYGKNDPYYGVFSADKFRSKNLDEAALEGFFESGETQIDGVLHAAHRHVNGVLATGDALDFGCAEGVYIEPQPKENREHWAFIFCLKDSN